MAPSGVPTCTETFELVLQAEETVLQAEDIELQAEEIVLQAEKNVYSVESASNQACMAPAA